MKIWCLQSWYFHVGNANKLREVRQIVQAGGAQLDVQSKSIDRQWPPSPSRTCPPKRRIGWTSSLLDSVLTS